MELRRPRNPSPLDDCRRALAFAAKAPRTGRGKKKALAEVRKAREYLGPRIGTTSRSTWRWRRIAAPRVDYMISKLSDCEDSLTKETQ